MKKTKKTRWSVIILSILMIIMTTTGNVSATELDTDTGNVSDIYLQDNESESSAPFGTEAMENIEEGTEEESAEETQESILEEENLSDSGVETVVEKESLETYGILPTVKYQAHVQSYGWMNWEKNGSIGGTSGLAKRLEAVKIQLENTTVSGEIEYRTHVQSYGWMSWVSDGAVSGTEGLEKRVEAIQIRLTGEMAEQYDIYYRLHVQSFGWLGWAMNGEAAGTAGYAKRAEAIQIVLVEKGGAAPGNTNEAYKENLKVTYQTHVQTYGWQDEVSNGESSGTTGEAKRLEAIKIKLENHSLISGSIEYQVHCQSYGWMDWVTEGNEAGTTGSGKRLEAVKIRLTGNMADEYDIYYRVHCQNFGWTGWAKNGDPCGSEGYAKRLEAIEICLVEKDGTAPGSTENTFYNYNPAYWGIDVSSYQGAVNWSKAKADGVEFAMIRITKKNTDTSSSLTVMEDPYFKKNAQGALANGIKIGGYVYVYASTPEEAKAEAEYAISLMKGYNFTYPIAFDLEEEEHMTTAAKLNNMAMAKAFCSTMEAAGYKTMVYGSPSKLRDAFDYDSLASSYEIWLARYRWDLIDTYIENGMDFSDEDTRKMVYDTGYEGGNWTNLKNVQIWQFSSLGRVSGISGNVDLNLCYKVY